MLAPSYHKFFHPHLDTDYLSVFGAPIPCAQALNVRPSHDYRFGIFWDEDKDHRILCLVDTLLHHNVLTSFLAFTEHEGSMCAVMRRVSYAPTVTALDILNEAAGDVYHDSWGWGASDAWGRGLVLPPHLSSSGSDFSMLLPDGLRAEVLKHRLGHLDRLDDFGEPLTRVRDWP